MLIRVIKTRAVFSMTLELPRCLCLVKRALKSTGREVEMTRGLSLWSGLCECFSQDGVGRRGRWRMGLDREKKKGWEGAMTKTGSRSSAFPAHPAFPVREVGCCGVSGNVECSGLPGRGGVGSNNKTGKQELNLPKQNGKPSCRREIECRESGERKAESGKPIIALWCRKNPGWGFAVDNGE